MSKLNSNGSLTVGPLNMKQMEKKWFDTYSDAEIWMLNSGITTDQKIHKEAGRYFIFVDENETK